MGNGEWLFEVFVFYEVEVLWFWILEDYLLGGYSVVICEDRWGRMWYGVLGFLGSCWRKSVWFGFLDFGVGGRRDGGSEGGGGFV